VRQVAPGRATSLAECDFLQRALNDPNRDFAPTGFHKKIVYAGITLLGLMVLFTFREKLIERAQYRLFVWRELILVTELRMPALPAIVWLCKAIWRGDPLSAKPSSSIGS
jgi:hypothetical protein